MDTDRFDDQARRGNPRTTAKAAGSTGTKRAGPTGNSAWRGGAIVVAIGCLLLLDNLGIVRFHDVWRYWPALVVAFGVSRIVDSREPGGWIWGGIVALAGAANRLRRKRAGPSAWSVFKRRCNGPGSGWASG